MDNKTFIDTLSKNLGANRKDITNFSQVLTNLIAEVLEEGDTVVIPGFGSFETKKKLERIMSVPSNQGKKMLIPPKIVASFKPSALLKHRLNNEEAVNENKV